MWYSAPFLVGHIPFLKRFRNIGKGRLVPADGRGVLNRLCMIVSSAILTHSPHFLISCFLFWSIGINAELLSLENGTVNKPGHFLGVHVVCLLVEQVTVVFFAVDFHGLVPFGVFVIDGGVCTGREHTAELVAVFITGDCSIL